ncbi:MAG: enoyl-CoA hydratase/isomerase family protein [Planctomycetota bacterium]|nr:MAG: enoyl-CoA hydratase/isomerase family protein [Planctomycetota bacterium]
MNATENVRLEERDEVVILHLTGPKGHCLHAGMIAELRAHLAHLQDSPAVVITGSEGFFSTGLHLGEVATLNRLGLAEHLLAVEALFREAWSFPRPLIAAVNGHAVAGGLVLALCADLRLVADDDEFRLGVTELAHGIPFPPLVLQICKARIPEPWTSRWILGAEMFSPKAACQAGLFSDCLPRTDLLEVACQQAKRLAAFPPEAWQTNKASLQAAVLEQADKEYQAGALDAWQELWWRPESQQRLQAAQAKYGE